MGDSIAPLANIKSMSCSKKQNLLKFMRNQYRHFDKLLSIYMIIKEIILATNNSAKLAELQTMLAPIKCIPQSALGVDAACETGLSFIENAIIKARHVSYYADKPALADDSGLVVPALNGEPGIYSARFAGSNASDDDNIKLLLSKLKNIQKRSAYFYCVLALVQYANDPTPLIAVGKLTGQINYAPQGEHGFGYDPIFFLPAYQCTLSQMSPMLKNTISHRALAIKQLSKQLKGNHHA